MSRVILLKSNFTLVENLEVAASFFARLRGLMGRSNLPKGAGMLIKHSGNSIHTCFMKFPIDVAFVTASGKVVYVRSHIKPWRMVVAPILTTTDCLELPAGVLDSGQVKIGDILRVEN